MMNEHYRECRTLPAINETFPQFSRPISLLSPLDLSLRAASNVIPITPPSTPSPPRKRPRLMSDENFLWRPHAMGATPTPTPTSTVTLTSTSLPATATAAATATVAATTGNFFCNLTYPCRDELSPTMDVYKNNLHGNERRSNFVDIPEIKPSVQQQQQQPHCDLATIYVDDETIELTEDEEDETCGSSHDYAGIMGDGSESDMRVAMDMEVEVEMEDGERNMTVTGGNVANVYEEEEEEEYVDILSNDDDELNPLSANSTLRLQSQAYEEELEKSGNVLTRNKLVYDNEEMHNQAIDGLAKLFDRDFQSSRGREEEAARTQCNPNAQKTYTELSTYSGNCGRISATECAQAAKEPQPKQPPPLVSEPHTTNCPPNHIHKPHKSERKRTKLRKNLSQDEETLSPVSGTIIRKLRDDEELVVRKGDIDPAFNVVEITEEAKAILASIDNKIGAYLCQLCRTLYDDAFMLAQHRCPRIVHIEYKCSECEKVFNCPANLASHRRWHKPKSELLAGNQNGKKRHANESSASLSSVHDKTGVDDGLDGIFPCTQCGKTFRRHAYLKKHQASHQMLENLKSLDIFKNNVPNFVHPPHPPHPQSHPLYNPPTATPTVQRQLPNGLYHSKSAAALKGYPQRMGAFPFPPFDQRRFYTLGEIYLSQQLERSSAFQYVQANHLRNLTANGTNSSSSSNFLPRPMLPAMMSLPVK